MQSNRYYAPEVDTNAAIVFTWQEREALARWGRKAVERNRLAYGNGYWLVRNNRKMRKFRRAAKRSRIDGEAYRELWLSYPDNERKAQERLEYRLLKIEESESA